VIPVFEYEGRPTNPLGFPMSQNRLAVPVWSYIMEIYPPKQIVELGSNNGGFTLALGLHAWNIGAKVFSYDTMEAPSEQWRGLAKFLGVQFIQGDVFRNEENIGYQIQMEGVTYLLCDNGNKPEEFNLFKDYLKSGDIIAVHDYCTEWWPWSEVTPNQLDLAGVEPFHQQHFDCAGWLAYRKL
jgi:cephalosporin hydroxylase